MTRNPPKVTQNQPKVNENQQEVTVNQPKVARNQPEVTLCVFGQLCFRPIVFVFHIKNLLPLPTLDSASTTLKIAREFFLRKSQIVQTGANFKRPKLKSFRIFNNRNFRPKNSTKIVPSSFG